MSADSELLIKIKTILESQGIDAAKAKLGELITTTNASSLSEANANKERDKTTDKAEKTAKAILAMNTAMAGGMGPFRAAIAVANQLGGSFAMLAFKASAVGAAMTIGWKMGTALRDWVTGAKEAEDEMEKIKKASDELRVRVSKLNDIRLDTLKAEAKAIADGFSTAVDKAERLKRLSDLREDTQLATDLAGVNLRFQKKEINENERDRLELKYQHESEQRKNQAEEKRINSQESASSSRVSQAIEKSTDLRFKSRTANTEYEEAVQGFKDNGGGNVDALISGGAQSPEYIQAMQKAKDDLKTAKSYLEANGKPNQLRIDQAQKRHDYLSELPGLKLIKDTTQKDLADHEPVLKQTAQEEAIKQQQLKADKDVLVEKSKTSRSKYQAGNAVIENKITSDYDNAVADARPAREKARDSGKSIIDSLGLTPKTMTDNAGLPLSQGAQASYDEARMIAAKNAIAKAPNASYRGGDVNAIVDELVKALDNVGARLVGTVHKDDLAPVLTAVKNLESQNSVSKGTN
jgi:hypothetical protein